jgi:hypothetical protein
MFGFYSKKEFNQILDKLAAKQSELDKEQFEHRMTKGRLERERTSHMRNLNKLHSINTRVSGIEKKLRDAL